MSEATSLAIPFILEQLEERPEVGLILGTGLGGLVHEMEISRAIPYKEVPGFPVATVEGHEGQLIFGKLAGVKVVAMQGRFHYYEGYPMKDVVFPVRVLKALGIRALIVSNASGGVNPDFEVGDLMAITDHINLFPSNDLVGRHGTEKFVDLSQAYSKKFLSLAFEKAQNNGLTLKKGVYAGLSGPSFETPFEYRYIRFMGADTVGMSTVTEVIAAVQCGLEVFAISVITDLGVAGKIVEVSHEEVQKAAAAAEPKMTTLIKEMLPYML